MSTTYSAALSIALKGTINDGNSTGWGAVASILRFPVPDLSLSDGNGAGKVNKLYFAQLTVAAGTTTTLTLDNGSLVDVLGNALIFGKLKLIAFRNADAAIALTLGGTNNFFTGSSTLQAGACAVISAPAGITVGAGNTITLANAGGAGVVCAVGILGSAS